MEQVTENLPFFLQFWAMEKLASGPNWHVLKPIMIPWNGETYLKVTRARFQGFVKKSLVGESNSYVTWLSDGHEAVPLGESTILLNDSESDE